MPHSTSVEQDLIFFKAENAQYPQYKCISFRFSSIFNVLVVVCASIMVLLIFNYRQPKACH